MHSKGLHIETRARNNRDHDRDKFVAFLPGSINAKPLKAFAAFHHAKFSQKLQHSLCTSCEILGKFSLRPIESPERSEI